MSAQAPPATDRATQAAKAVQGLLDIPFCPHDPMDNPQQARFLTWFGLEALYGGAAGGGKSDALIMAALQFVDVPGYAALLLRRRYTDLRQPGALLDRAESWFAGLGPRWRGRSHTWVFPSGAKIVFGYLDEERDKYRYQSAEFQYIAFDELTQFSDSQYRFLFTRLRRPKVQADADEQTLEQIDLLTQVPLRMRAATNPGGRGHEWVRRRWSLGQGAEERKTPLPPTRRFYRATMHDNPYIDTDEYERALAELDPLTRAQMEHGLWVARDENAMLQREWFSTIMAGSPAQVQGRVRYWDLAASEIKRPGHDPDYTAGARCSRTLAGIFVVEQITRFRKTPAGVEDTVRQIAVADGKDVPIWIEQEPGSSGKSLISHYRRNVLPEFTVRAHAKQMNKVAAAAPWAARAQPGEVWLVEGPWVNDFLDECDNFPTLGHDDQVDAVSGAYAALTQTGGTARVRRPQGRIPGR